MAIKNTDSPGGESTAGLKKGLLFILLANTLSLVLSLVSGFFLPKFLSIPSYAELKTFQLYVSYIGVLHLGYLDGVYIRYGGKTMSSIPQSDMSIMRTNIFVLQAILSAGFAAAGIFLKSPALFVFALCLIPENTSTLYKNLFQATGEYSRYANVLNIRSVITLVSYLLLLFVFKTDNYIWFTLVYLLNMLVVWIYTEIDIKRRLKFSYSPKLSVKGFSSDMKSGLPLMLGNFAVILLTGIDRWFVKFLFNDLAFAAYSFAVSIQSMLNTFVVPLSVTLYNYLCRESSAEKIKRLKDMCMIFGLYVISSAFVIKLIIELFIDKYTSSLSVLFMLFAAQLFFLIIQSVYVNVYKARKQQVKYLKQLVLVLVLGAAYNAVFYLLLHSTLGIAIGTLLTVVTWYIICLADIPELRFGWRQNVSLISGALAFIAAGYLLPAVWGFIAYLAFITCVAFIFNRVRFFETLRTAKDMLTSKLKRKAG